MTSSADVRRLVVAALVAAGAGTACAPNSSSIGAVPEVVPGLVGEYFNVALFQDSAGTFEDANIDFPVPMLAALLASRGVDTPGVSVRWQGQIHLARSEAYTIAFATSGRVRVSLGGALAIDRFMGTPTVEERAGAAAVSGGAWYDITVEWDQPEGMLAATLLYSSPSQPKVVVPPEALRHPPLALAP